VLYTSLIRERFRQPRHRGRIEAPDAVHEDVNPLCGDRIRIECRLDDGRVAEARHSGDSCAIAAAAADVLVDLVEGKPAADAARITVDDLLATLGAEIRRTRLKCVALPLDVLRTALSLPLPAGLPPEGRVGRTAG
jgi:nitrogen fixation NifU-like protein